MDSLPESAEFLNDLDIEELCSLVVFPNGWEGEETEQGGFVDQAGRFKYPYTSPSTILALAPEDLVEVHGGVLAQISDPQLVTASAAVPWCPRGEAPVPIIQGTGQVLVKQVVPLGYVWFIDGYALNLFPSQANELNYFWQIRVDGMDILNKGNLPQQPGRPVQAPTKVTIGRNKADMFLAQQGSVVEVVVIAINTLGASDTVAATIFGQLQGVGA